MALLFAPPFFRATDITGNPIPGAFLGFFATGTSTPQPIYADAGLQIFLTNPVQSDGNGWFPAIFLDDSLPAYKYVLSAPDVNTPSLPGAVLRTGDPYNTSTQNIRTPAEVTANVTPSDLSQLEGDLRRYGADITSNDNAAAWDAARNVSAAGGKEVFIPPGRWKIATQNAIAGCWSVRGVGAASILAPQGVCDGIAFGVQGTVGGARFIRDFTIDGANTTASNGISINFTGASGGRVSGCQFSNLAIYRFNQAVFSRGLWQSTFRDCFIFDCYQGYYFHGQNVVVHITGGFVQKVPTGVVGAGTAYGVLADTVSGETTQSLHLENAATYNYDINVCLGSTFYATITNCDLSICNQIGVQVITCRGGVFIRNNWIQTNNAAFATVGVQVTAVGTPINERVIIDGNQLTCQIANGGSIGIDIQAGNTGVVTTNNTIGSSFANTQFNTGVKNTSGAHNHAIKYNTIAATTTAVSAGSSSTDLDIGPNFVISGTPLSFDAATPLRLSYYAGGTFVLTLTGMTGTITGTITWAANGRTVTLSDPNVAITGTSNATTMTGTGLPAYLWPNADRTALFATVDSGTATAGVGQITAATGVITFFKSVAGAAFTNTGSKGLSGLDSTYSY